MSGLKSEFLQVEQARAPSLSPSETGLAEGTIILTLTGEVPVQDLEPGDRIVTRDGGARILRRIDRHRIAAASVLRVARDALGQNRPERDTLLNAEQPLLLRKWLAKALYGSETAMTPAHHMIDGVKVAAMSSTRPVWLYALSFDQQHVIYANGLELASAPVVAPARIA